MTPAPKKRTYKHTSEHYAALYGCGLRTIKRYRQKEHAGMVGYPLDDPEAMAHVFAAARSCPSSQGGAHPAAPSDDWEDPEVGGTPKQGGAQSPQEKLNAAKLEKVLLECQRLAFRNEVERAKYTLNTDLQPKILALLTETKTELRKALENELPPKCEGLSAAEIQLKMREALDEVLGNLTRGSETLADLEPHELDDDATTPTSDDA